MLITFGVLWIGTFGQGLYIYDPEERLKHLTETDNISNNSILNIDGAGQKLWLATLGGITEIRWVTDPLKDDLRIIDFQEKYNFPANYVYDVYVGDDGRYGLVQLVKACITWNKIICIRLIVPLLCPGRIPLI